MDKKYSKTKKKGKNSRSYYRETSNRTKDDCNDNDRSDKKRAVFTKDIENDIAWWSKYPDTMRMAANIPYAWPTGVSLVGKINKEVGCAMLLPTTIGIGVSKDSTSPANIQFRHLVSKIVQKLGGSGNGDPADYAEYLLALDSIYAFISWCTRIYGLGTCYSPENRFIPQALLTAEGLNPTDIRANYAQLRAWINLWINQIETYAAPADVALFDRHIQLFGNIYTDFPEPRGQIYAYTPFVWYKLDEANGKLVATQFTATGTTPSSKGVADIVQFGNQLISALTNSQIYQDLSARIRRAYGEKLYHIGVMPEEYKVEPVYSQEMLLEIHNTVLVGPAKAITELDITQDPNTTDSALLFDPIFSSNQMYGKITMDNFVDVPIPGVIKPEVTMIASRGLVTFVDTGTSGEYKLGSCGTEIVHGMVLALFDGAGVLGMIPINGRYTIQTTALQARIPGVLSTFDWAPYVSYIGNQFLVGDTTKIGILSNETVDLLNRVALESALDVPRVTGE